MTRLIAYALVVAVLGIGGAAAQDLPLFRGTGDAVHVFVTVTDKDGRIVTTLSQADFDVRDEGKPQPITLFDNTPQPIRLVVLLDVSGSMVGNLPLLRDASRELFARLDPKDAAVVGSFGKDVTISPTFTNDPTALMAAVPTAISPDSPTPLWFALDEAMEALKRDVGGRSVILVLSDGKDSGSIAFRRRVTSQAGVIDRARAEDVMIYAIGLRSRSQRPSLPGTGLGGLQAALVADLPDPGLARVAEETGGGYTEIRFGQDLGAAFAQVATELHSQYLLGYAPPRRDGKAHDVEVRVTPSGLKPRARKSYVAPKE